MKSLVRQLTRSPGSLIAPLALVLGTTAWAQGPAVKSPEVNADQSVTVRYYAPGAHEVAVSLDYDHHPFPLKKGDDGIWTYTTPPLAAEVHMYALTVDGLAVLDPLNPLVDRNFVFLTNQVRVRKPTPQPWDVTDVPHGVIHHHQYRSAAIAGLKDGLEDYYVYTPPAYLDSDRKRYPVLYLLHGWSSMADSWIAGGQANLILDNLIAKGDAAPMVVVMPLGYGDLSFVLDGFDQWNDGKKIGNNLARFSSALLSEILPQVEKAYAVRTDREGRAIAGLSMGGGESLIIGLSHPDLFSWIGGFSSAVNYAHFESVLPSLDPQQAPKLLWIACGTSDELVDPNRRFVAWIKAKGFAPTAVETAGIHNWPVWRDNLVHFAPLLFRPN